MILLFIGKFGMVTLPLEEVPLVKKCGSIEGTLEGSPGFPRDHLGTLGKSVKLGELERENSFIFCKMDYLTSVGFGL